MNHLLFSLRAAADTAVNTLAMTIILNVTQLRKVLTENHTKSRSSPAGEARTKRSNLSQSIVSVVHELQTEVAALQLLCVVV